MSLSWYHFEKVRLPNPKNDKDQLFRSCWSIPLYQMLDMPSGTHGSPVIPLKFVLADKKIKQKIHKNLESHLH